MSLAIDPIARNRERQLNGLYGIGLVATLAFVTMTFAALILVFFIRSRNSFNWTGILMPPVLWIDTAILLASSLVYERGHRRLREGSQAEFFRWTSYAAGLGVAFLVGQVIAWWQILRSGQLMTHNPHSSFFFILSGVHAAHILVALAGVMALLYRTKDAATGPKWQMNTRVLANVVAIFWHYLDFVWIVLFVLLLVVGR